MSKLNFNKETIRNLNDAELTADELKAAHGGDDIVLDPLGGKTPPKTAVCLKTNVCLQSFVCYQTTKGGVCKISIAACLSVVVCKSVLNCVSNGAVSCNGTCVSKQMSCGC